ncbi:MAG: hypothetical protein R3F31_24825 [Verrucomicrobiales bacterium]
MGNPRTSGLPARVLHRAASTTSFPIGRSGTARISTWRYTRRARRFLKPAEWTTLTLPLADFTSVYGSGECRPFSEASALASDDIIAVARAQSVEPSR